MAGLAAAIAPPSAGAKGSATVIRDVRASAADIPLKGVTYPIDKNHPQPDTQIEPSIAVNPGNSLNAVASFQEDRVDAGGDAGNGWATTTDGGKTWHQGYLPGLTRYTGGTFDRASDAVVTFGTDPAQKGHYLVYANSLVFNDGSGASGDSNMSGMAINVSRDSGLHWTKAVILEQDGLAGLNDKNWIVADNGSGTGHKTGRVYVVWDRITPMVYTYCDAGCDKLSNWADATSGNNSFYVYNAQPGIGSWPLVLPDGSLAVIFQGDYGGPPGVQNPPTENPADVAVDGSQLQIALAPSAGAVPFPAPLTFTPVSTGISANNGNAIAEQRAGSLPAAAVDLHTGEMVVAWEDGRLRKDGLNDIFFSTSTNGVVWTPPHRANEDSESSHINHWNAMVDIANGVIHIGYQQRVQTPGPGNLWSAKGLTPYIDTYYQQSNDDGKTWSAPLRVNRLRSDVRYAAYSRGGAFLGDYNQIAVASNGRVYLVHNVAMPKYKGEPCNCSFVSGNGHQHQYTYVSVIQPARK
jgi:hypothetical protein